MDFTQSWAPWTIGETPLLAGPLQLHIVATTSGDFLPLPVGRSAGGAGTAAPPAAPAPFFSVSGAGAPAGDDNDAVGVTPGRPERAAGPRGEGAVAGVGLPRSAPPMPAGPTGEEGDAAGAPGII